MHYQRHLNPEGDDSLGRLLRRIPERAKVLELGPATGYCSRYLSETLGCTVDAVELSEEMAEQARPWCRSLVVGDIESVDLAQVFAGEFYDVILCADVLEHLRDPWSLAARLTDRLAPEGRLLLSVPNVGYLGLLVDLLRGNFRYRDEGLLDRSHLRFFTFDSLRELLEQSGWHLWDAEQVGLSLTDSEFRVRLESLTPALRDEFLARSDALCYQWVVEARRTPPPLPVTLAPTPPEDHFQVRVFWRNEEAGFDYPRDRLGWAALGRERQSVALEIPAQQCALALRLSDRVSFVRLHGLQLLDERGALLWRWAPAEGPLAMTDCVGMKASSEDSLWFVTETESRLILDLPQATVAAARRLVMELGTPLSADYLAAKNYWENPQELPVRLAACEASRERLLRRYAEAAEDNGEAGGVLPRILHLLPAGGGGMERCVRDLCNASAKRFQHYILRITDSSWLIEETTTASYRSLPGDAPAEVLRQIAALAPALLHLHSLNPAVARAARLVAEACGASLAITLHDVLFADPQAFEAEGWPAGPLVPNPQRQALLDAAAFLTAPSRFVADLAHDVYGLCATVVPNGIHALPVAPWDDEGDVRIGDRLCSRRVAVLGALGGHKGSDHLFDVASRLPEDVVVVVIGYLDGQLTTGWAHEHHCRLSMHPGAARIFVSGPYAPTDLPELFRRYRPQLVYFPSRIPESFGYTLSEAWACGAIPVVPDLGALSERVTEQTALTLPDYRDAEAVARCLDDWSASASLQRRQALRTAIRAALPKLVPSLRTTARSFAGLYERFTARHPLTAGREDLDQFSELCELNLDPAQFRTELRQLLEESQSLHSEGQERARWVDKLEDDVAGLKTRNIEVERQLTVLAQTHREQALAIRQELAERDARLTAARAALGEDESAWPRYGRVIRVARKIPGLLACIDRLAAWRR